MTPPGQSDTEITTLEQLGEQLRAHQAGIRIDFLYDHGWQVGLSNPGGSLYVHGHDYPEKWPDEYRTLPDVVAQAVDQAKTEGWW